MSAMRMNVRDDPEKAITAAKAAIDRGACVVLPTDTVYGIGADATSAHAVSGLLAAKNRGRDMPPPVLVSDAVMVRSLASSLPPAAIALGEALWPGALTLIVTAHPSLRMDLGDRFGTIAVRVPDHEFTRELLRATGPLAVSSANVSGQPAAATIEEAEAQLGTSVALYLDDGPAGDAAPSTIVDVTGERPQILRAGRIPRERIAEIAGELAD